MIFIYIIIAFLLGLVFAQWLMPLIDSLVNLLLTQLEVWKGNMAVKITKSQVEASQLSSEASNEKNGKTSAIGFIMSEEGDDYSE